MYPSDITPEMLAMRSLRLVDCPDAARAGSRMTPLFQALTTVAVIAWTAGAANGATVVWGGGNGTFSTAANWVGGTAPVSTDTVSFGGWAPLDRTGWVVSASVTGSGSAASNATDGHRGTLWTTTVTQAVNQSFTIDMGSAQTFRQITIDSAGNTSDYPRAFNVYASSDGASWGSPITSGAGASALVTVTLTTAVTNRYIKIQLSSSAGNAWSIGELFVYGTASETELSRSGWVASASAVAGGAASNAIDGSTGTRFSPGAVQASGQWFSLDMGSAQTFTRIDMDAYSSPGDYPHGYDVYVSSDGATWGSAIASQTPSTEYTSITFTAQTKRYIKIQLNAAAPGGNWWSLYEIKVYGTPANCNLSANVSLAAMSLDNSLTVSQASGVTITLTGGYAQSAGTFTGGNSTIDVAGAFTLSGGTFTSTSGRLEVGGAFTKSGGTFTHNSGQVMLNSTSSSLTFASGGAAFYDLTLNDGLIAYWPFDETSGPSLDRSGYGRDATWSGSPTASTTPTLQFTNAHSVASDSSTDLLTFTSPAFTTVTVSAWINATAAGGGTAQRILDIPGITVFINGAGLVAPDNPMSLSLSSQRSTTTGEWKTPSNSITYGSWYHIAITYDPSSTANTPVMYINGVSQTVTTKTTPAGTQTSNAGSAYIGNRAALDRYFNGSIDDLRLYDRILSATEIQALAAGRQPATGLATQTLTGNPTVVRDLTIATGTLAAGSSTLSVGGSWNNWGGVFTGTGVVTFNGSVSGKTILSGGQAFGGITVSGSGLASWTLADALLVPTGTLAINAGTLAGSTYAIQAGSITNGGGTFTPSSATTIITGTSSPTVASATYSTLRIEDPSESNLVGYWKLDTATGTSARDDSGSSLTGTLTGSPQWTTSVPGTVSFYDPAALMFTGANYVDVSGPATATNAAFTACAWVDFTSISGHQTLVGIDGTNISGFFLKRDASSSKFSIAMYGSDSTGATGYFASGTTTPTTGTWYHVCGVFTGSAMRLYVNGTQEGTDVTVGSTWSAGGHTVIGSGKWAGARTDYTTGIVDDVRIYNVALTTAQVAALAAGRYAGTGGTATATLAGATTVNGTLAVDSGTLATSTYNLTAANTDATKVAQVTAGTLSVGTGTVTMNGGLNVAGGGTLSMASAGTLAIASGKTLIVDGTLNASNASASITSSGTYTFKVGSTSTATPTLNITGLAVSKTDASGMWINANTSASTTFTRFDNIAFSSGTSGGEFLQIYATALYLSSNGCTFDIGVATGTTSVAVLLTGNGTGDGETRAVFGNTTCANNWTVGSSDRTCLAVAQGSSLKAKTDGDADGNGVADSPVVNGGSVVQFIRAAGTDTAGTLVGLPTAAFNWNTFAYYSTYAAYNTASGTSPTIYVRNGSGTAQYSWTGSSGETIVGAPRWNTDTTTGKHYLYVAMWSGSVYQLIDNGTTLTTTGAAWTTNPYNCTCTIVTPLGMDTTNLYWGGTQSGSQKLWTLSQASPAAQPMGSPFAVTNNPTITNAAPLLWTSGATTYLFVGTTGHILQFNVSAQTPLAVNDSPGTASIWGRIAMGTKTTDRVLAADDAGKLWSIAPTSFAGSANQWVYTVASDTMQSSPYYDYTSDTIMFGTEKGKVVAINAVPAPTTPLPLTGYPYLPGATTDSIRSAPLYRSGILLVGSTTGKVFVLDRNNGTTGPTLIQEYYFGPTQSVSGIAFDPQTSRYMVTTSSTANDGKLYYIDAVTDPTPGAS